MILIYDERKWLASPLPCPECEQRQTESLRDYWRKYFADREEELLRLLLGKVGVEPEDKLPEEPTGDVVEIPRDDLGEIQNKLRDAREQLDKVNSARLQDKLKINDTLRSIGQALGLLSTDAIASSRPTAAEIVEEIGKLKATAERQVDHVAWFIDYRDAIDRELGFPLRDTRTGQAEHVEAIRDLQAKARQCEILARANASISDQVMAFAAAAQTDAPAEELKRLQDENAELRRQLTIAAERLDRGNQDWRDDDSPQAETTFGVKSPDEAAG